MAQKIYQVDAFTREAFSGNPAAVCPLDHWLSDAVLQNIAMENNLSETAFYVKDGSSYRLRWFTPVTEVDLCGHATLASAYVLFNLEGHTGNKITFLSDRSGILTVAREGDLLTLDFPADGIRKAEMNDIIRTGFNILPEKVFMGKTDYLLVYRNEKEILDLAPDFGRISELDCRGIIVTAKGDSADFVSRFFGPQSGINEDPVTGSAHTTLTPYWSERLGRKEMDALQLSQRRGYLHCTMNGERVGISGRCRLYLTGHLTGI